jgi:hypothetical protein
MMERQTKFGRHDVNDAQRKIERQSSVVADVPVGKNGIAAGTAASTKAEATAQN